MTAACHLPIAKQTERLRAMNATIPCFMAAKVAADRRSHYEALTRSALEANCQYATVL
jgi:hypothetical protein